MKYCSHCGAEINENAVVCVKCGCSVPSNSTPQAVVNPNDAPSGGFAVLGFFFPLIGLILFLVWNNSSPQKAKSCGKGALIGFILSMAGWIILTILTVIGTFVGLGSIFSDI